MAEYEYAARTIPYVTIVLILSLSLPSVSLSLSLFRVFSYKLITMHSCETPSAF